MSEEEEMKKRYKMLLHLGLVEMTQELHLLDAPKGAPATKKGGKK